VKAKLISPPSYNETYHKTHYILGIKSYMFWHQGSILREFNNNKGSFSASRTLGASHCHFHH